MRCSDAAVLASLGVIAVGCACSGLRLNDAGVDVGVDTGADAGTDAGRDTPLRDAGTDAWALDGGWTPVPGATAGCLEMASAALVAATVWPIGSCPDRAGCRRIASPGGPPHTNPFRVERGHGAHDGTRGLVAIFHDAEPMNREEWIVDDRGRTVAGFRSPRDGSTGGPCMQASYDVSATSYAFGLDGPDPSPTVRQDLFRGTLGFAPTRVTDLDAPSGGRAFAQELRIDTGRVAAWMSSQVVEAVEADGSISTIANISPTCDVRDVVGDAIFVFCQPRLPTIYVQRPGGTLDVLLDPTIGNDAIDSDGTTMAWLRYPANDAGAWDTQLWASPHAIRRADVRERRVATLPPVPGAYIRDLRIGFGYAAVLEQPDLIGVYRLADGARAALRAPAGEHWSGFVQYVGPTEIAATTGPSMIVAPHTDYALMFVRLDSLTFVPSP